MIFESPNGKDWTSAGKGYGFDWAHAYFAGQDFAVGWPGDKYRGGATAGGPWADHPWPSTNTQGIGRTSPAACCACKQEPLSVIRPPFSKMSDAREF